MEISHVKWKLDLFYSVSKINTSESSFIKKRISNIPWP